MRDPIYMAVGTVTQHVRFLTPLPIRPRVINAIAERWSPAVAKGFDVAGLHPTGGRFDLVRVPVT
jgi:hypothetical protein